MKKKNEKEIMILIEEKKRGEERHIRERRESRKSRITKVPLSVVYTLTPPQVGEKRSNKPSLREMEW